VVDDSDGGACGLVEGHEVGGRRDIEENQLSTDNALAHGPRALVGRTDRVHLEVGFATETHVEEVCRDGAIGTVTVKGNNELSDRLHLDNIGYE
jgi:hypothetical protein